MGVGKDGSVHFSGLISMFCDGALKWDFVRIGSMDFLPILLCLDALLVILGRKICC